MRYVFPGLRYSCLLYTSKVGTLVSDKKDFKTAAEEWMKENPRYKDGGTYRMSSGAAAAEGSKGSDTGNEAINNMIRGAFGRK